MSAQIIDRGRGPEIEGTRVTVYRIMDFVRDNSPRERIASELRLSMEQVEVALAYIAEHGKSETAQIAASVALLDRGWGKPVQTLHATHALDERDAAELTDAELMALASRGNATKTG